MKESNIKTSYLWFILSIPLFFILLVTALYFTEMDEWVVGTGQIVPADEYNIFLPENSQLIEFHAKPGEQIKKGAVLAKFYSIDLEIELANLKKELVQIQDEIKLKEISHALLILSPIEEKFENAQNELEHAREKVEILKNRLSRLDQLKNQGMLSAEEVDNIRSRLAEAKNEEKAFEIRASKDIKKMAQLQIEKSNQEVLSLKNKLTSNENLQTFLKKRLEDLTIIAPEDGIIIDSPLKYNGSLLTKGTSLFTISKSNERRIEMTLSEKNIIYIKQDLKVRFEPNTYSVFELDYFWGNVVQIIPQSKIASEKNALNQYTVYSNIKLFGKSPISNELSSKIPYGSSGKCAISIGRKSLLLQLIGWN